jgi:hypothetical protein
MSELRRLDFLLWRWTGRSVDQFGEKGVLESSLEYTKEPSEHFLQARGQTSKDGTILNKSVGFITYDSIARKYVWKRVWSYGFIENGEGDWEDADTIVFQIVKFDNEPADFAALLWRSFIRRYGDDRIGHGLYTAKSGEEYRLYGETRAIRVLSQVPKP